MLKGVARLPAATRDAATRTLNGLENKLTDVKGAATRAVNQAQEKALDGVATAKREVSEKITALEKDVANGVKGSRQRLNDARAWGVQHVKDAEAAGEQLVTDAARSGQHAVVAVKRELALEAGRIYGAGERGADGVVRLSKDAGRAIEQFGKDFAKDFEEGREEGHQKGPSLITKPFLEGYREGRK